MISWTKQEGRCSFFEKLYSHLFFLFFVAQILSPSIGERTIYLELLVALLNPFFLFWLKNQPIKRKYFVIFLAILIILAFGKLIMAIKLLFTTICVSFLFYSYKKNIFYLKQYIFLSILLAILQFYFIFFNTDMAKLIGPTNIAQTIWGDYATATFTNFYTVFWFPRVSGLSREAGFFASFLVAYMFFLYLDNSRQKRASSFIHKFLITVGYIVSFSKMSFVIFALFILEKLKSFINKMPIIITLILFITALMFFWKYNTEYLTNLENITFTHRFAGYVSLFDINLNQLLFGIDSPKELKTNLAAIVDDNYGNFAGLSGFILHNGIFVILILITTLYLAGINSAGILVLLFLTTNVQLDTNQNFVVLAYFIIFKYYASRKVYF